jgi:imidazolonepropionase-like amidohydrolase
MRLPIAHRPLSHPLNRLRSRIAPALLAATLLFQASPQAGAADLAIVGARILPSPDADPIARGTVVVRDGRIVAVGPSDEVRAPAEAEVIEADGLTLTAGFWNSHVHLLPDAFVGAASRPADELAGALRDWFTRWGFTTVFDIASKLDETLALRRRIEAGEVPGPRVLTVGDPFFPAGGTPIYVRELYKSRGYGSDEVESATQARERATAQLARGADGVKVFTGAIVGPPEGVRPLRPGIAAAAVEPARARSLPAFAHPTDPRGIRIAIDAGVNVLAHTTPTEGPWPEALARELAERGVALVPTLTLLEVALAEEQAPPAVLERLMGFAQQQVRALRAAGGDILFGTDVGFIEQADTTREYRLLAGAGLDHRAILRALTTAPVERFGDPRRTGRVAVGYDADLVLLGGDPAKSVEAFADVRRTIRAGRVLYEADR